MSNIINGRCFAETAPPEPPLIQHGSVVLAAHDIGWIVSGVFSIIALAVSFWLIWQHLSWYTNKREQRYIVRILLMVPIYAVISFGSYLYWNHATALLLIRDCYEAIVLTSFFYLMLNYLSHDPEERKDVFRKVGLSKEYDRNARGRGVPPSHWMFPIQFVKWKPEDGLYFLQLMKWGVLQYCVVRPTTTLAAVILDYVGLYCEDSWGPGWGHLYITVVMSISVTIAMYCLLQLYFPISEHLAPHKPLLKMFAVKAVVFLTFWQATLVSLLQDFGVVKGTTYMTSDNVATGISAILECVEMALFALLHVRAYTYRVYRDPTIPRLSRWRALVHALNFKETFVELSAGCVYMWHRMRGRETDPLARRGAMFENVFGKSRHDIHRGSGDVKGRRVEPGAITMEIEEITHVDEERQWLGLRDEYAYGLGYHLRRGREKSEGLEEQIGRELTTRGYRKRESWKDRPSLGAYTPVRQEARVGYSQGRAWWRDAYARMSRTSADRDTDTALPDTDFNQGPKSFQRVRGYHIPNMSLDDPPPPSSIRAYRNSQESRKPPCLTVQQLVSIDPPSPPHPVCMQPHLSPPRESVHDWNTSPDALSQRSLPRTISSPSSPRDSDSFFRRAFTNLPEPTTSVEQVSSGPSSSQSHRTQVRLCAEPIVLPKTVDAARAPVFESPPSSQATSPTTTSPHMMQYSGRRLQRANVSLERVPEGHAVPPTSPRVKSRPRPISSPPGRLVSSRLQRSSRPDEQRRRSQGEPTPMTSPSSTTTRGRVTRYTPRGFPIVLPTPLAPAAGKNPFSSPVTSYNTPSPTYDTHS